MINNISLNELASLPDVPVTLDMVRAILEDLCKSSAATKGQAKR